MRSLTTIAALAFALALAGPALAAPQHQQHQQHGQNFGHSQNYGHNYRGGYGPGIVGGALMGGALIGETIFGSPGYYDNDQGCIRWVQTNRGMRQMRVCD